MNIIILLKLIGGLVLFLYGIEYLGEALKKVSGGKLEKILEGLTNNKWKAALLGMLVTAAPAPQSQRLFRQSIRLPR